MKLMPHKCIEYIQLGTNWHFWHINWSFSSNTEHFWSCTIHLNIWSFVKLYITKIYYKNLYFFVDTNDGIRVSINPLDSSLKFYLVMQNQRGGVLKKICRCVFSAEPKSLLLWSSQSKKSRSYHISYLFIFSVL